MSNNLFGNMKTDGLEQAEDRLGGFQLFDSKIYLGTVKALYAGEAKSGAMNVTVVIDLGGREYRETIYISNKKKENFFTKDGKKQPLPGFTLINDICLISTEKELSQLQTEEKIVKLWDRDSKKEIPTAVQMITEALGKPVAVGILKVLENKTNKNDSSGEYEPIAETRETNRIDKVFHPEAKVTVAEARAKKAPEFWDAWSKKNADHVRDEREIKDGQTGAPAGSPPKAGADSAAPKKSLFGGK